MKKTPTFKEIEFKARIRKIQEKHLREETRKKDLADNIMELVKAGFTKAEILEVIKELENQ